MRKTIPATMDMKRGTSPKGGQVIFALVLVISKSPPHLADLENSVGDGQRVSIHLWEWKKFLRKICFWELMGQINKFFGMHLWWGRTWKKERIFIMLTVAKSKTTTAAACKARTPSGQKTAWNGTLAFKLSVKKWNGILAGLQSRIPTPAHAWAKAPSPLMTCMLCTNDSNFRSGPHAIFSIPEPTNNAGQSICTLSRSIPTTLLPIWMWR